MTASFLSPNFSLFSIAFFRPCRLGILKPASCSKPTALPRRQAATRSRLAAGMFALRAEGDWRAVCACVFPVRSFRNVQRVHDFNLSLASAPQNVKETGYGNTKKKVTGFLNRSTFT